MSKSIRMILGAVALAILAWAAFAFVTRPQMADGVTVGQFTLNTGYARASGKAGAVFFHLTNTGGADRLIGASSPASKMAELHTHIETADGIMQMRQIEGGVAIGAGQTITFKRGGDHVMLMGLNAPLEQDTVVPLTLVFATAGQVTFDVTVDNDRKAADHSAH